jgi:hypothetical protein
MTEQIPWALRQSAIKIGDAEIPCAVLDNGERVLTQQGVLKAIGRARAAKGGQGASVDEGTAFLRANNLKPFVSKELEASTRPIIFRPLKGGYTPRGKTIAVAYGVRAESFPGILKVYADADAAGKLHPRQKHIGEMARRMLSALPKIGMIALVDEATGYQEERAHNALQLLLEAYVLPEHRPWIRTIPREFTKELHRVYGWNETSQRGPRYAGKLTRKYLYEGLPAPVLPELDKRNPVTDKKNWQRKRKHHSYLTEAIGIEHFRAQLAGVMALLRASPNKRVFESLYQRAYGRQKRFPFMDDLPDMPDDNDS